MAGGSKGPAVYLIRGNAQYRNAYLIAEANGNWFAAVDAVLGMAAPLPREANFHMPEPPECLFKMVKQDSDKIVIQKWLMLESKKVENAISQYVHKFYKMGASSL